MFINNPGIPIPEMSFNVVFQIIYVPNKFYFSVNMDNQRKDSCL